MVLRLSIVLVAICLLKVNGISIRGTDSTTYDPANPPLRNRFTCQDGDDNAINDATWTRDNNPVESNLVQGGRLVLENGTIGTANPQRFEGRYRCHSNSDSSRDLSFYVAPSRVRLNSSTVDGELEGQNVSIECPLRFGSLRDGWSVEWIVEDSQGDPIHPNKYFSRKDEESIQLVIKKASIDFDKAKFECHALRDDRIYQESQTITLNLFHEPQITSGPTDPVVVSLTHGIVTYKIKAYPRPTVRFCYNNTCTDTGHGRIQITNHENNETSHTAQFTINTMTEADNGNVTLELSQSQRNFTKNYTVMIFLPYKIRITKNGSVANRRVPLLITLRRPLHFQYHIDFFDMKNEPLGSMEGMRGQMTFTHMLTVERDTDVMAQFRIGEVSGPASDPVTVNVENSETPENSDNNMVFIVVAVLVAIVLLAMIAAVTCVIITKSRRKERSTPRTTESGAANVNENEVAHVQPAALMQSGITMNPINPQPHIDIAVHAPTPGHHNMPMSGMYRQGPMMVYGSANSNHSHSSIPSRKSSAGYESGTESCHCSYMRYSPYASNYQPRCCHCDRHYTPLPQHQEHHHHQQQVERVEDEQDNTELVNSQQQPAATTNFGSSKSSIRRNLSDPNISRHKQPPSRSLVEQRTTKLLSSSSVV